MPDFIRNLVLRGSGAAPPLAVQPVPLPQFPPALTLDSLQNPPSSSTRVIGTKTTASSEAGGTPSSKDVRETEMYNVQSPAEAQMDREPIADSDLLAHQPAPPAALTDQPPNALIQPQEQLPIPPVLASLPLKEVIHTASLETKLTSTSVKSDRTHSESKLAESTQLPGKVGPAIRSETQLMPTIHDSARHMRQPIHPYSPSVQSIEPAEMPQTEVHSLNLDRQTSEDGPMGSQYSLDGIEPFIIAPSTIHESAQSATEPVLSSSRQVLVEPRSDGPAIYPLIQPILPVTTNPATSSPPIVEVRIGTLEVRASQQPPTSPSPLAPKPQGFDNYAYLRGWDGG
jgi:hypothetical protein